MKTCPSCHQSKRTKEYLKNEKECEACKNKLKHQQIISKKLNKWIKLVSWPPPKK